MQFNMKKGLTLVEVVVGVSLFTIIAISVYGSFTTLFKVVQLSRVKITAVNLANEQFEFVKHLQYADIGISGGIPDGVLDHELEVVRDGRTFTLLTTIRNIDDPFDGTLGGSPNDLAPADNKLVEVEVRCDTCTTFSPIVITSRIAPKDLEQASTNGALFIQVIDADGNPVEGADVHVENNLEDPPIVIDDVTNATGQLQIIDAPPGTNAYEISISKDGFTSAKTYAIGDPENPNPSQPHANLSAQQVTQITFVIDEVSSIHFRSMDSSCNAVGNIDFDLTGNRLIGTGVRVNDFSTTTNSGGTRTTSNIAWDSFNLRLTDSSYDLLGSNPINPFDLLPGSDLNVDLIVTGRVPKSLLVAVQDSSTGLPISDAEVHIQENAFNDDKITGQGFVGQTDWSAGGGQDLVGNDDEYFAQDGNIEDNSPSGQIQLDYVLGEYVTSGELESSTFDVGTTSNFKSLLWLPASQDPETGSDSIRFQFATGNDPATTTWDFVGPDGTDSTYFTTSDYNISSIHNGDRYARYKAFFQTASTTLTPMLSDVQITYASECIPPGQALFTGLLARTYKVEVVKAGYQIFEEDFTVVDDWQQLNVVLIPE